MKDNFNNRYQAKILDRFPVLKLNGVLRTRSRAAQFSRSGRPKRGNLESCGGKNVHARFGHFHINWSEPVLLGRPERTSGKRLKLKNRETCVKFHSLCKKRKAYVRDYLIG